MSTKEHGLRVASFNELNPKEKQALLEFFVSQSPWYPKAFLEREFSLLEKQSRKYPLFCAFLGSEVMGVSVYETSKKHGWIIPSFAMSASLPLSSILVQRRRDVARALQTAVNAYALKNRLKSMGEINTRRIVTQKPLRRAHRK
jgi:hypothetical protein